MDLLEEYKKGNDGPPGPGWEPVPTRELWKMALFIGGGWIIVMVLCWYLFCSGAGTPTPT